MPYQTNICPSCKVAEAWRNEEVFHFESIHCNFENVVFLKLCCFCQVPTRLEKEKLREYSQLDERYMVRIWTNLHLCTMYNFIYQIWFRLPDWHIVSQCLLKEFSWWKLHWSASLRYVHIGCPFAGPVLSCLFMSLELRSYLLGWSKTTSGRWYQKGTCASSCWSVTSRAYF